MQVLMLFDVNRKMERSDNGLFVEQHSFSILVLCTLLLRLKSGILYAYFLSHVFPAFGELPWSRRRSTVFQVVRAIMEFSVAILFLYPVLAVIFQDGNERSWEWEVSALLIPLGTGIYLSELLYREALPQVTLWHHCAGILAMCLVLIRGVTLDPGYFKIILVYIYFVALEFAEHAAVAIYNVWKSDVSHRRSVALLLKCALVVEIACKTIHQPIVIVCYWLFYDGMRPAGRVYLPICFCIFLPAQFYGPYVLNQLLKKMRKVDHDESSDMEMGTISKKV